MTFELAGHQGFLFSAKFVSYVIYINVFVFSNYPLKSTKLQDQKIG
jgi:hypothetical protein